jgi:hypothetical protein
MSPAELLGVLRASGIAEPIAIVVDGVVVLAGDAHVVAMACEAMGDRAGAERIQRYRRESRGFVITIDRQSGEASVEGVPRDVTLTATGGDA